MFVVEFDPEHGAGEDRFNTAFNFDVLFFHGGINPKKAEPGSPEPRPKGLVAMVSNGCDCRRDNRRHRIADDHRRCFPRAGGPR